MYRGRKLAAWTDVPGQNWEWRVFDSYASCVYFCDEAGLPRTPLFARQLPGYLADEGYRELQRALLPNPEMGVPIPGTGGLRKLRWEDARRSKGKRSSLRGIFYYLSVDRQVWFFTLYDKDEATDLTPDERKAFKAAVQAELTARRRRR